MRGGGLCFVMYCISIVLCCVRICTAGHGQVAPWLRGSVPFLPFPLLPTSPLPARLLVTLPPNPILTTSTSNWTSSMTTLETLFFPLS